jgi:hypothetical protein
VSLQLIGAGIGRTGTHSLKIALEQLLGSPCYHMMEVFGRPDDVAHWHAAANGQMPDWDALFEGYAAAVDWPASAFWRQLAEHYPEAPVLLSVRESPEAWWKSADRTIFEVMKGEVPPPGTNAWMDMATALFHNTFADPRDKDACMAAYERHNAAVREGVPASRLVEWQPGDGWDPICKALGIPVPDEPFPHVNSTEDFRANLGLDA